MQMCLSVCVCVYIYMWLCVCVGRYVCVYVRTHPHTVQENARLKALEVFERLLAEGGQAPHLVIGGDTGVLDHA
jgi:hypothetical protein